MNIISEQQFAAHKKSDTIVILGSGWSINKISNKQWELLSKYDSIAFNWFCFHSFEPTFYLIREQANIRFRRSESETPEIFTGLLKKYHNTYCVILNVARHTKKCHDYSKDENILLPSVILEDNIDHKYRKRLKKIIAKNPFNVGLFHGVTTLTSVLHLITYLGYKRIIFAGIDLYDSRYFWLRNNKTRHTVKRKGLEFDHKHSVAAKVLKLVRNYAQFNKELYCINKKSLLCNVIGHLDI